jgi:carbamoyltransferase
MKILGISCFYHDSAAAVIDDGKIIAAAEEERFSRIKHDSGFPIHAIEFCLEKANLKGSDLNWVVFYEKPFLKFERITLSSLATVPKAREMFVNGYKVWLKDKLWIKSTIAKNVGVDSKKILFTQHHISHAAVAYYTSPFDSAAILTCDAVGEWTTTSWGSAKQNKISLEKEIKFPHSFGLYYSAFTQFLGFQINEGEFKVMGLAPYGKPRFTKKVERLIRGSEDGSFHLDLSYFNFHLSDKVSFSQKFIDLFGVEPLDPKKSDEVIQIYADIAASAQKVLDEKLLVIARNLKEKTGEENLCYSGGVSLNGVTNWKIFKEAGFKNIFIHPAAGDSGGALGAALYTYHHVFNKPKNNSFTTPYLGQENSEGEIKEFLEKNGIKAQKCSDKELVEKVSDMLYRKKVIGWVRGRFEWGPRALGARSILADPRDKKMKDLVNAKIKFREAFRPFAPVCLYQDGDKYFEVGKEGSTQQPLQYMIAVVPVRGKWQPKLGAITHVDGTARPQFIKREVNPMYYDVIKAFGKKAGINVLLNTSFNLKGQPIVNTCQEAYDTFMKSGIDALVLGNYLIIK